MAITKSRTPDLPKGDRLAEVIERHSERERSRLSSRLARWYLAYSYLQGYRSFQAFDSDGNLIHQSDVKHRGKGKDASRRATFRLGEFLRQVNDVAGVIGSMNLAPVIEPGDISFDAHRQAASARVLMGAALSRENLRKAQMQAAFQMVVCGTVGVTPHVYTDLRHGILADYECVHARELMPFPSLAWNLSDLRGNLRYRVVSVDQLREVYGARKVNKMVADGKLKSFTQDIGDVPDPGIQTPSESVVNNRSGGLGPWLSSYDGKGDKDEDSQYRSAYINELRLEGPHGLMDRMAVTGVSGVVYDRDLTNAPAMFDLPVARFFETGEFHGAGMFDAVFSLVKELEDATYQLLENVRNADQYPILILPQGSIHSRSAFGDDGKRLKVLQAAADQTFGFDGQSAIRPLAISPIDSGDTPRLAATSVLELLDRVSPLIDIVREKGRVDGATGLRVLQEAEERSLFMPVQNFRDMFVQAHRAALSKTNLEVVVSNMPVPVTRVTLDLAGTVIDPEEGTVSFPENPLPEITRLKMGVEEEGLPSPALQKQEALELYGVHQDLDAMLLYAIENGVELAMDLRGEKAAYESIVMDIVTLYGDGLTPGEVAINPHMMRVDLQRRVLDSFMQSYTMRRASSRVQEEFIKYREALMQNAMGVLPENVSDPYDLMMRAGLQQSEAMGSNGTGNANAAGGQVGF